MIQYRRLVSCNSLISVMFIFLCGYANVTVAQENDDEIRILAVTAAEKSNSVQANLANLRNKLGIMEAKINRLLASDKNQDEKLLNWEHGIPGVDEKVLEIGLSTWDVQEEIASSRINLLGVLLAFFAGAGVLVAYILKLTLIPSISQSVTKIVENEIEEMVNAAKTVIEKEIALNMARVNGRLSIISYNRYYAYLGVDESNDEFLSSLGMAINLSEAALSHALELDREKFEKIIGATQANVAYHLAVRQEGSDQERAIELAKKSYDLAPKYRRMGDAAWYHWTETFCWVQLRFGGDEAAQAKKQLNELYRDDSIPPVWKEKQVQKYKKCFEPPIHISEAP